MNLTFTFNINSDTDLLNAIHDQLVANAHAMETLMDANANLTAGVNQLKATVLELTTRVSTQIQQLVDAVSSATNPDPAVIAATEDLQSLNTQIATLNAALAADDPA